MNTANFDNFDAEPEAVTLTFGKHRGKPLADVEASYLEWVLTADRITPELKTAITAELAGRAPAIRDRWRCPDPVSADVLALAELIVAAGECELAASFGFSHTFASAVTLLKTYLQTVTTDPGDLPF